MLVTLVAGSIWGWYLNRSVSDITPTNIIQSQEILGRYLFFDTRLSFNNTKSCASCHSPVFAFSDGYRRSATATGDIVLRNAPSLLNSSLMKFLNWADPLTVTLERQHEKPLFNEHPVELGVRGNESLVLGRFKKDSLYRELFRAAFPGDLDPVTIPHSIQAIASYVRTLRSEDAPYDRYLRGDSLALSRSAKKGMRLFFSDRLKCASCHPAPYFTQATRSSSVDSVYANIGLYNVGGRNVYPQEDQGLAILTGKKRDSGRFRIPSLRNLAFTAPYMHDGSVQELDDVLHLYAAGGRNITEGPYAGDGRLNKNKDVRIGGFELTSQEKVQIVDFLMALSDSTIFRKKAFYNPF